ncbi:hypothetical protein SEPCBS57363_004395 [Sporothrix epigloea]|uniref:CMP/dCMP-type deaminase domain-containing protein n=1 Tax=Sporothrix epigloea TaxID=1892477 RepID=A0ABP0DVJ0_9PEZI
MHLHPSIKSDNYLNLCLEQASLSPLTFRHGSVIVKGGKVIGAGFNDYRSGFNGGTLKTGALNNSSALSSTASMNSGANAALSMHSEMMAIHSALGNRATAMRGVRPLLSSASAKQSRLAVEEYAEAVLRAAGRPRGRPASMTEIAEGTGWCFEGTSSGLTQCEAKWEWGEGAEEGDDIRSDDDCHGSNVAHRGSSNKMARNRSASPTSGHDSGACSGRRSKAKRDVQHRRRHARLAGADLYVARLGKSGSRHLKTPDTTTSSAFHLTAAASRAVSTPGLASPTGSLHDELLSKYAKSTRASPTTASASSSLAGNDQTAAASSEPPPPPSRVAESRPCYRCITYMHSVGIKRVFWTNSDGVWEGAKVRDLVDSMEAAAHDGNGGGPGGDVGGMFVTKHEVLLVLRALAEGGS